MAATKDIRLSNAEYDAGFDGFRGHNYGNLLNSIVAGTGRDVKTGRAFSQTDKMNKQLEYAATMEERAYNEYLYKQYQSPAAMVRQYEEAGLNPAMMYADGGSSVSAPAVADGSEGSVMGTSASPDSSMTILGTVLQMLFGAGNLVNQSRQTQSTVDLQGANARKTDADAQGVELDNEFKRKTMDDRVKAVYLANKQVESATRLANSSAAERDQAISESIARINKMHSDIEVNGSIINKNNADALLTAFKAMIAKAESDYADRFYKAYASYTECNARLVKLQGAIATVELDNLPEEKRLELNKLKTEINLNLKHIEKLGSDIGLNKLYSENQSLVNSYYASRHAGIIDAGRSSDDKQLGPIVRIVNMIFDILNFSKS